MEHLLGMASIELGDLSFFVSVVESGGIGAAARALSAPKSSVSRRVSRLEERLGVRLLLRSTTSVVLTEAGRAFYDRVSVALHEVDDAAGAAVAGREVAKGLIRLSAPPDVGAEVLPHLISTFIENNPEVVIEVELSSDAPSLIQGGYDLALRVGPQPDSSLVSRKVQNTSFKLYGSPGYLAKKGMPQAPEDLHRHRCLLARGRKGIGQWSLSGPHGEATVAVQGPVVVNDLSFIRRAAIAGLGIALLPDVVGDAVVKSGALQQVLCAYFSVGYPLYIVYPSRDHVPLRVRSLRDHIIDNFPKGTEDSDFAETAMR